MQREIKSVHGAEPRRDGEYPSSIVLEYNGVVRIEEKVHNHGTYDIIWFVGYNADNQPVAKMNASFVETVTYGNAS